MTKPPLEEIAAHTALRGVAALCVVLYHVSLACKPVAPGLVQGFIAHSYLFVDLFFGLSGYILARKYDGVFGPGIAAPDLRRFFVLRFARLYPNYLFWFLVAVAASLAVALRKAEAPLWPPGSTLAVIEHLTATQGLLASPHLWNVPLWSIGVEFMLYAIFPILVRLLFVTGKAGEVLFCVLGLAILLALSASGSIDIIQGGASVLRGLASFSIGAVIARHGTRPAGLSEGLLSGLQALALGATFAMVALGQEIPALLAFYGLIFASQFNAGFLYGLSCQPLARLLGALSYSVYLSHAVMLQIALMLWYKVESGGASGLAGVSFAGVGVLTLGLSLGAAKLAYVHLERPAQAWLTRALIGAPPLSPRNHP